MPNMKKSECHFVPKNKIESIVYRSESMFTSIREQLYQQRSEATNPFFLRLKTLTGQSKGLLVSKPTTVRDKAFASASRFSTSTGAVMLILSFFFLDLCFFLSKRKMRLLFAFFMLALCFAELDVDIDEAQEIISAVRDENELISSFDPDDDDEDDKKSSFGVIVVPRLPQPNRVLRLGIFMLKAVGALENACRKKKGDPKVAIPCAPSMCSREQVSEAVFGEKGLLWWFRDAFKGRVELTATDADIIEIKNFSSLPPSSLPPPRKVQDKKPLAAPGMLHGVVTNLWGGKSPNSVYDRVVYLLPGDFTGNYPGQKPTSTAFMTKTKRDPFGFDVIVSGCQLRSLVHELIHNFNVGHAASMFQVHNGKLRYGEKQKKGRSLLNVLQRTMAILQPSWGT
jgi:hypothetical protein